MIQSTLRTQLLALVSISFMLVASAMAEIPQVISYQGKITDAGGTAVGDDTYTMCFRIYDAVSGGSSLWDSGDLSVATTKGVASVLLGESPQPALGLAFDADYWLQVTFQGTDQTPRVRMTSVGYAYMASGLVPGTEVTGALSTVPVIQGTNTETTSDAPGVKGQTNSTMGYGVWGVASATVGYAYGGLFESAADNGRGLSAHSSSATGQCFGVFAASASSEGNGVGGFADATTGVTCGVYGQSSSTGGTGVHGHANATAGLNCGVLGTTNSPDGYAGYFNGNACVTGNLTVNGTLSGSGMGDITSITAGVGLDGGATEGDATLSVVVPLRLDGSDTEPTLSGFNSLTSGSAIGVFGHSSSTDGRGVEGYAAASTGNAYGVYGESNSSFGAGVRGYASSTAPTATASGVRGESKSAYGAGVYGLATASTGNAYGGEFWSSSSEGNGVHGVATASTGSARGGDFSSSASEGTGVAGEASASSGATHGGYFRSSSSEGTGVYGVVSPSTNADRYGVHGYCFPSENWGIGVRGEGGYRGVHGVSTHFSGAYATYGVYGEASGAAVNWGVYASGNLGASGTKSAIVRTEEGPKAVYCMESTEVWFEDFGSGEIRNGQAVVRLAGDFLQTVVISEVHPLKVFITPKAKLGDWWIEDGTRDFRLVAPDAPDGARFDFRVVAKRSGYEGVRLEARPEAYSDHFLYPSLSEVPGAYQATWLKSDAIRNERAPERGGDR